MRRLYRQRREAIRAAAARHLADWMEFPECHTGLHLVGWLPAGVDDVALARDAAAVGVTVTPCGVRDGRSGLRA
jgi:GntR family transcriptional regulator / MocR family aminotransferase